MVTLGHSCDITPLLTSLALSKSFDISATEGMVVVGMVVTNLADAFSLAVVVGNLTLDFVMSPPVTQETLLYVVAVKGVVRGLVTPFAVLEPWFRFLVPRVFDGVDAGLKDVLGNMPVHGQVDDGVGV